MRESYKLLDSLMSEEVSLSLALCDESADVRIDRGQLTQILLNLVVNARDSLVGRGTVAIETAILGVAENAAESTGVPAGSWVRLTVEDSGRGMDEETQAHIFEPFFTTKSEGHGTGLGLSTVYGILQRAGGHIRVSSPPGGGARFEAFLPRVPHETQEPASVEAPETGSFGGDETVLVVEDRRGPRAFMVRALEKYGYTVLHASLPSEALAMVEQHGKSIGLLVTDVVMPEMNGPELAAELRANDSVERVLFVSGYASEGALNDIEALGAELLLKPFTVEGLVRGVRRAADA